MAAWSPTNAGADFPFMPTRVVLQDFTGVPAIVDLASMRDGIRKMGGNPARINPMVPADLVIDHSVQVDFFGTGQAFEKNVAREYERNRERYALLRWAPEAFENYRVVPPGTGIVHQVNLEYLASVIHRREDRGTHLAYPDTLVGTDSHTTMINGLGVGGLGRGRDRSGSGAPRPALLYAPPRGSGRKTEPGPCPRARRPRTSCCA